MSTSRRVCECLLAAAVWLSGIAIAAAGEVERTVLAEGLADPTAVTAHAAADGGVRVLVAESGNGRLTEFNLLGERVFGREVIGSFAETKVTGLGVVGARLVVLGSGGFSVVERTDEPAEAMPAAGETVVGPPAVNDRWLFAPGEAGVLRSRVAQGRITRLRAVKGGEIVPLAIAFSPEGYLAVVTAGTAAGAEASEHRLRFYDPNDPSLPVADYPLAGLARPIAIVYTSQETLYTLNAATKEGAEETPAGLYRIEVALEDRRPSATATLVATIDRPTGMTILPAGDVVVTTSDGERGSLLRLMIAR